jgi:SAM-dependent methyltransferase
MPRSSPSPYPEAAVAWLVGEEPLRVLDVGSGGGTFARLLAAGGHQVFALDRDPTAVTRLAARLGGGRHVAAQVEALPFLACRFDAVTAVQSLHRFAPGLALPEIARVLRPGGHLAVAFTTRDETVPWVRRLLTLLRQVDPGAAQGDYGLGAVEALAGSPWFSDLQQQSFRHWVPVSRPGLVAMVERQPAVQRLEGQARAALLGEVGALYDASARPPEPLLLPYRASCWRARPDHARLGELDEELAALEIRL